MGKFKVSSEKEAELLGRMEALEIYEEDIVERFIKGSGAGGQKINKTSSCVQLKHEPSGIEVKCQQDRSQALNRYFARRELCDKIEEKILGLKSKRQQAAEKIRRQKRRRSKRAQEKTLEEKHKRAAQKSLRKPPSED
jgi:protein subunit release factor B